MKIEEMADVFLNSANFVSQALLTFVSPSSYALNLKSLIMVSKVSWTSHFHMKYLDLHLKKIDKTDFISSKRTPQNTSK